MWHSQLGYAHPKAIHKVWNLCKVPVNNKEPLVFFKSCCLGKAHALYAPLSKTNYTTLFKLVNADLQGPSPTASRSGYSYYIAFFDYFSMFTWIYLLKYKSDALSAFKFFQSYVSTQFNVKIKTIQSDLDGEFRYFTKLLDEQGIVHMLTLSHT